MALAQLHPGRVGAGDRARVARALLDQLGDERDLGVRARPRARPRAGAGRRRRRRPAVPAARRLSRSRSRISAGWRPWRPGDANRGLRGAGQWCWHAAGYGYLPSWPTTLLTPPFVRGHDHALGDAGPALVLFGDYEDPDSRRRAPRRDGAARALGRLHLRVAAPADRRAAPVRQRRRAGRRGRRRAGRVLGLPPRPARASGCALRARPLELCGTDRAGGGDADRGHASRSATCERILDDVAGAMRSGTLATPSLFIEGVRWEGGWEPDALEGALRAALAG